MHDLCSILLHTGLSLSNGQLLPALQRRTERHAEINFLAYGLFLW